MANNRMMIVCNLCYPTDDSIYENGGRAWADELPDIVFVGKWYPVGSYRTKDDIQLGRLINEYLDSHAHVDYLSRQVDIVQNENPVRLTYEKWVRDMPAIKKWAPKEVSK